MTPDSNSSDGTGNESNSRISRRKMLKAAGVATVGAGALAGNASASVQACFYGCSQVCIDDPDAYAVVVEGNTVECYKVGEYGQQSNRRDPCAQRIRDDSIGGTDVYCLSIEDVDGDAIVGACNPDRRGDFIPNEEVLPYNESTSGGRCAENYYETVFRGTIPTDCPC